MEIWLVRPLPTAFLVATLSTVLLLFRRFTPSLGLFLLEQFRVE